MKKISLLLGVLIALSLSGCVKLYKDVKTDEYATYQMSTKGEPVYWNDSYYVNIYDFSKGCNNMVELGLISAGFGSSSDIVKLPVEVPLLFKVTYLMNQGNNQYRETTNFILTPENGKHYIVEYEKKEVDGAVKSDYHVYTKNGGKSTDIPDTRIRDFKSRDCM